MLLSAVVVGFETVAIEGGLRIADLSVYLIASVPIMIGGAILLGISPRSSRKFTKGLGTRGWASMGVVFALAALGVLLWYDAVGRIGASKEAIIGGGSSEILFIVILSSIFLGERLSRLEATGSLLVVFGVFVVLANHETLGLTLGIGETEAIVSSLFLAVSVVFVTKLLREHDLTPLSGIELLGSGFLTLVVAAFFGVIKWPTGEGWLILVGLGVFPAVGLLTYNAGLPKIGASLTSVLYSLSGIITVAIQLLVLSFYPDADIQLPDSLTLAVLGSMIAFVGVYLLNVKPSSKAEPVTK